MSSPMYYLYRTCLDGRCLPESTCLYVLHFPPYPAGIRSVGSDGDFGHLQAKCNTFAVYVCTCLGTRQVCRCGRAKEGPPFVFLHSHQKTFSTTPHRFVAHLARAKNGGHYFFSSTSKPTRLYVCTPVVFSRIYLFIYYHIFVLFLFFSPREYRTRRFSPGRFWSTIGPTETACSPTARAFPRNSWTHSPARWAVEIKKHRPGSIQYPGRC